jgi:hypothetical protein
MAAPAPTPVPTPDDDDAAFTQRLRANIKPAPNAPVQTPAATTQTAPTVAQPPIPSKVGGSDDDDAAFEKRLRSSAGTPTVAAPADQTEDYFKSIKQGLVRGVAGLAGLPATALEAVAPAMQLSPAGISSMLQSKNIASLKPGPLPSTENLLTNFQNQGLYDPKFQGATVGSRVAGDLAAATPNLLAGPYGLESTAYTYGPALAASLANESPLNIPKWITGPATALIGSGGQRVVEGWMERNAATQAEQQAKEALAAHEAGTPGFKAQSQEQVQGGKTLAKGYSAATEADAMKRHDSEHTAADNDREAVASTLGDANTLDDGMSRLQDAARTWRKTTFKDGLKEAEEGMYYKPGTNNTQTLVPEDAQTKLTKFMDALEHSHYSAGEAEPLAELLQPYLPKAMLARIKNMGAEQGLPPGEAPTIPLGDARKLSTALGNALDNQKIVTDTGAGKLNEMYAALQGDKRDAIGAAAGPEGLAQFDKFNEKAKQLYATASGPVSDVIGNADKSVDKITPEMARGRLGYDSTKLKMLASDPILDKGLKEYGAPHLRLGTPLGDPGDADKVFSNMSPDVKGPLFGDVNAGKVQNTIDSRAEADANLDVAKKGIKDQAAIIRDKEAAFQRTQKTAREQEGVALKQGAATTTERKNALTDPTQGIYNMLKHAGGTATGILSGLVAGHYGLEPGLETLAQSAQLPPWMSKLAYPAFAYGGYLAKEGLGEIGRNPKAVPNMLRGGMATQPFAQTQPGSTP